MTIWSSNACIIDHIVSKLRFFKMSALLKNIKFMICWIKYSKYITKKHINQICGWKDVHILPVNYWFKHGFLFYILIFFYKKKWWQECRKRTNFTVKKKNKSRPIVSKLNLAMMVANLRSEDGIWRIHWLSEEKWLTNKRLPANRIKLELKQSYRRRKKYTELVRERVKAGQCRNR